MTDENNNDDPEVEAGPEEVERKGKGSGIHDAVSESPLGLVHLCESKGKRFLLDFFLTQADEGWNYTKADLVRKTDLSRQTVHENLMDLVYFDIVKMVDKDGNELYDREEAGRPFYQAQVESETFQKAIEFSELLTETYNENHPRL